MEPVTATIVKVAENAKKVAEVAKKIQKIYNVSKEMKSIAESEGKDQLQATSRVASSASKLPSKETKGSEENGDMQPRLESQYGYDSSKSDTFELKEGSPSETLKERLSVFDEGLSSMDGKLSKPEVFDESIPLEKKDIRVFVEDMPSAGEQLPKPEAFEESIPLGSKCVNIFNEGMPSKGEGSLNSEVFDESVSLKKMGSPFEKIGIDANIFQNEGIPQQECISNTGTIVERSSETNSIETAENRFQVNEMLASQHSPDISEEPEQKKEGLTDEQKKGIKEKTGWSDTIVDSIRTMDEVKIYMNAGLQEGEVNGNPALLQPKIDGKACNEPKWPDWSNKDLTEEGYPPRDETGRPYELHHIGQNPDSPLAELTYEQHHCNGNFKKLHTFDESSIDRQQFNKERKEYWKARSQTL